MATDSCGLNMASQNDCDMEDGGDSPTMHDGDKGGNSGAPQPDTPENPSDDGSGGDKGKKAFKVKTSLIPKATMDEQPSELQGLGLDVYNQDDLEQGIMAQVDEALAKEERDRIKRMIERQMTCVTDDIRMTQQELERINKVIRSIISATANLPSKEAKHHLEAAKRQRENKLNQMRKLKAKRRALNVRLDGTGDQIEEEEEDEDLSFLDEALGQSSAKETEEERMIRMGEMTPFGTVMKFEQTDTPEDKQPTPVKKVVEAGPSEMSEFEKFLLDKEDKVTNKKPKSMKTKSTLAKLLTKNVVSDGFYVNGDVSRSHTQPQHSNFFDKRDRKVYRRETDFSQPKFNLKKKRQHEKLTHNFSEDPELSDYDDGEGSDSGPSPSPAQGSDEEYIPDRSEMKRLHDGDSDDSLKPSQLKKRRIGLLKKRSAATPTSSRRAGEGEADTDLLGALKGNNNLIKDVSMERARDDGNVQYYEKRLRTHQKVEMKRKQQQCDQGESDSDDDEMEFEGGFTVPGKLWNKLYGYQRTGVKWLWELHCQQAGGIVGDEMGLGKTIQMITFLASLKHSKIKQRPFRYAGLGPTIIVCPATVMHQWVREFHKWWPAFRVAILHSSGSYTGTEEALIQNIVKCHGVLITSFSTLVNQQDALLQHDWHYIILDEGHKIRNPDAQVTLACKQFRTPHRIILSGSPVQNNLKELWSLFDFVFPGKLGTLPDFMAHFSVPIVQGGYSNATQVQVQTAYKCACVLRDTINPYLLRRLKADVKESLKLPSKNEQVLFCRLTDEQRDVYQEYLDSSECNAILAGKYKVFAGLITLRKICNHPDLTTGGPRVLVGQSTDGDPGLEYGFWRRSGKLIVVEALLKLWKNQGQRVLLFSQSKQMLDILETFVQQDGYSYLRMDGGTTISSRQPLINKYNSNPNIFLFLLTTRVGGLGVNLTGANRVVIFDPDWNPSTDTQARERAWRIGQNRQVTIYRLLTTGTIEEKIYHRQIFKQFLTNRVLKDPKQRRFFKTNDMYELFTLGSKDSTEGTETSAIFAGIGSDVNVRDPKVNRFDAMKKEALPVKRKQLNDNNTKPEDNNTGPKNNNTGPKNNNMEPKGNHMASKDKMAKMREMAKMLSHQICKNKVKDASTANGRTETESCDTEGPQPLCANGNGSSVFQNSSDTSKQSQEKKNETGGKSERKKKKKKSRRQKDATFEGEKIPHLAKTSDCNPGPEEDPNNAALNSQQDDYVLHRLFKKTGIQGALQHDAVVNASKADYALVEGEADRVAKEAAAALKRSRKHCMSAITGIPTWTGQRGSAGGPPPPPKPRFGQKKNSLLFKKTTSHPSTQTKKTVEKKEAAPASLFDGSVAGNTKSTGLFSSSKQNVMSSGELLQRMRERNNITNVDLDGDNEDDNDHGMRTSNSAVIVGDQDNMDLITDIRNFIAFQCHMDGQASTQELLDEFGVKLPQGDSAKFKAMLRQICDFDRSHDVGIWHLKREFR